MQRAGVDVVFIGPNDWQALLGYTLLEVMSRVCGGDG